METAFGRLLTTVLIAGMALLLAACGGETGAGIASAPPPPPAPAAPTVIRQEVSKTAPLNPTPAIVTGNYNAIAIVDGAGLAPPARCALRWTRRRKPTASP